MTALQLSAEINSQLQLISGNTDLMWKVLDFVRGLTTRVAPSEKEDEYAKTKSFIDSFAGKWVDDRSADEMISDIYSSRRSSVNDDTIRVLSDE